MSILPPKQKLVVMISLSFASAFMLFIYTPLDIYLHNPTDFVVGWKFLLPPLAGLFVLCFFAVISLLLLIWHRKTKTGVILLTLCGGLVLILRFVLQMFPQIYIYMLAAIVFVMVIWVLMTKFIKEDAFNIIALALWGILTAAYIQTLFLNGSMVMITGQQTGYSELSIDNIINMLIWVVILLLPLCLFVFFKIRKKVFHFEKALILTVIIMIGMQSAGLISTAATTDLPPGYEEGTVMYKSYEATSNFNADENILVYILDRMDVLYMNETLERYPHLRDYLDGFTHYENNITEYWDTFPSVTSMLTHYYYIDGQTYEEYWAEAWARRNFMDVLRENGFTTNLYLDFSSTYGSLSQLHDRADNLVPHDKVELNIRGLTSTASRLSLGRLSPYLLKNLWLGPVVPNFGINFIHLPEWVQQPVIGIHADLKFYEYIKQAEYIVNSEKSVFTIMHLNGAHVSGFRNDPSSYGLHYDDETASIQFGGDVIDSTRVTLEILNIHFNKMKEIGVYGNSTIIMLADHGFGRVAGETASLLIKPAGSTGPLQADRSAELSHKYFGAGILDAANIPNDEFGISYFDIIGGSEPPVRLFYSLDHWFPAWIEFGTSAALTLYGIYEVTGDASIPENWNFIPTE
jgi:hypothetical protein